MNYPLSPTTWRLVKDKSSRVKASKRAKTVAGVKDQAGRSEEGERESLKPPPPVHLESASLCPVYTELTLIHNARHN